MASSQPGRSLARDSISVIMPTYNGERFVREQIESILAQSCQDFALHIFDDGSTDRTVSIVEEIARRDQRVIVHSTNSHRLGVIANINRALTEVDADIYFLSDQDDIWLPEKIAMQLDALADKNVLMCFSNLELVDESGNSLGRDFWSSQNIRPAEASVPEFIAIKTMVTGCTMAFKKELLDIALPIPPEATMHDHWLSFFAAVLGGVAPIDKMLVKYRQHSNNTIGGMIDSIEVRRRRYQGCRTYREFKERKSASFQELLDALIAFQERLARNGARHKGIDSYIDFFQALIHHEWLHSCRLALKMKRLPDAHSFIRTALVSMFFPLVYLYMRVFGSTD